MRGSTRNKTCSTYTKKYILLDVAVERKKGKSGGGHSRQKWDLNGDLSLDTGFYNPMGNGSLLVAENQAQYFGPTVTISLVDPNSLITGDIDIYIYGTNLSITTGVALKKDGVTYAATNWSYDSDALGAPANPSIYVELPAFIYNNDIWGVFDIVITNSYGSTEFPAMVTYGE